MPEPDEAYSEGGNVVDSVAELSGALRAFTAARDWEQFHTPKNLAMALAGEVRTHLRLSFR